MHAYRLNLVLHSRCTPDWRWEVPAPGLRDHDLWYVHSGVGWLDMERNGRRWRASVGAGLFCLLEPGVAIRGRHDPGRPLVVTAIHFENVDAHAGDDPAAGEEGNSTGPVPAVDPVLVERLLARMTSAWLAGRTDEAEAYFPAVLGEYRAAAGRVVESDRGRRPRGASAEAEASARSLGGAIRSQPARRWRLADLAERAGLSEDHFCRVFRVVFGCTPGQYVIDCRVAEARSLLRESSHSVTRIAQMLGYRDVFHFSSQFRARTGRSPTAYRDGR